MSHGRTAVWPPRASVPRAQAPREGRLPGMSAAVADYLELGLTPPDLGEFVRCAATAKRSKRQCRQEAVYGTDRCVYHDGLEIAEATSTLEHRQQLQAALLPTAIRRLAEVLNNPETKDENVIRAAFGLMDRVGLAPVQGIELSGTIETAPPLELLQTMLTAVAARLAPAGELVGDVQDAEVVG